MTPSAFVIASPLVVKDASSSNQVLSLSSRNPRRKIWSCNSLDYVGELKKNVLASLRKLDFGRSIVKDIDAQEVVDQNIQELERMNKSSTPALDTRLAGSWRMIYTTNKRILGVSRPRFLRPKIMDQNIDLEDMRVQNIERLFVGPVPIETAIEAEITDVTQVRVTVQFNKFIFFRIFPVTVAEDKRFMGFFDVTYLDDDIRIVRGNEGNLFVLERVN